MPRSPLLETCIARACSAGQHLILDNYGTHKTPRVRRWLAARPRYHVHFASTGTSRINLVERWLALLSEKQIERAARARWQTQAYSARAAGVACRTSQSALGVELAHDAMTVNPAVASKASRSAADQY